MDKKQQILHLYRVDELSLRDISRKLNVDRKTVTRLINVYEAHIKSNPESGIDETKTLLHNAAMVDRFIAMSGKSPNMRLNNTDFKELLFYGVRAVA